MTRGAASRIQSAACKACGGVVQTGSFAARAMSAAYKNESISSGAQASNASSGLCRKIGFFAVTAAVATAATYYYFARQKSQM